MDKKNRDDVALRFAESLVAQMLQRSGAEFEHTQGPDTGVDFVLQADGQVIFIEVKYTEQAAQAETLWKHWAVGAGAKSIGRRALPRVLAGNHGDGPMHPHLVIVTGNGDKVFADAKTAPLLVSDDRTEVSILSADSKSRPAHGAIAAIE
jgi:hypothetical protein